MTNSWPTKEPPIEKRNVLLVKNPISKMDLVYCIRVLVGWHFV
jgi:hypothetical protein